MYRPSDEIQKDLDIFIDDVKRRFINRTCLGDMMTDADNKKHLKLITELIESLTQEGKI